MMNLVKTRCGNFRWIYTRAINPAQQINSVENCRKKMGIFVTSPAKESLTKVSSNTICSRRFFAKFEGKSESMKVATYEEVKDLCNHPEKLLIDVREPHELLETGCIPTSINIPLNTVEESLKMSDADFKAKYHRDKPTKEQEVIFHCKMGGRAGKATDIATALGFLNAKNYKGSWAEWSEKEGLPNPQKS